VQGQSRIGNAYAAGRGNERKKPIGFQLRLMRNYKELRNNVRLEVHGKGQSRIKGHKASIGLGQIGLDAGSSSSSSHRALTNGWC
jgi:hypothetical protein